MHSRINSKPKSMIFFFLITEDVCDSFFHRHCSRFIRWLDGWLVRWLYYLLVFVFSQFIKEKTLFKKYSINFTFSRRYFLFSLSCVCICECCVRAWYLRYNCASEGITIFSSFFFLFAFYQAKVS